MNIPTHRFLQLWWSWPTQKSINYYILSSVKQIIWITLWAKASLVLARILVWVAIPFSSQKSQFLNSRAEIQTQGSWFWVKRRKNNSSSCRLENMQNPAPGPGGEWGVVRGSDLQDEQNLSKPCLPWSQDIWDTLPALWRRWEMKPVFHLFLILNTF